MDDEHHHWRNLCFWALLWAFAVAGAKSSADETHIDQIATSMFAVDSTTLTAESCPRHLLADLTPSSPSYFNQLRQEATEFLGSENTSTSSYVFKVTVPNSTNVYRIVELKSFIPLSDLGNGTVDPMTRSGGPFSDIGNDRVSFMPIGDGFAALLAVHHFNNIELSPILSESDVSACPDLKLTMSLLDSKFDAMESVRLLSEALDVRKSFKDKPAAGILGEYGDAVNIPLSMLTGINRLPQVSPAAGADYFDDKDLYPLFGRTISNMVRGKAQAAVDFFKSIGSTHVAVLYVTNTLGTSSANAFQEAAKRAGLKTTNASISYDVESGSQALNGTITWLARSNYRHVYAILFEKQFPIVMKEAIKKSVVGPDYFYLTPSIGLTEFNSMTNSMSIDAADTAMLHAFNGLGTIHFSGGFDNAESLAKLFPNSTMASTFYKFNASWVSANRDSEFVQFAKESLPESLTSMSGYNYNASQDFARMGSYGLNLYDAVTAMAIAMCNTPNEFFTGEEVYDEFRKTEFFGASGLVKVDNFTGSRLYETIDWEVWNCRYNSTLPDGNASFTVAPAFHFVDSQWEKIPASTFIYASGSEAPPHSFPALGTIEFTGEEYVGIVIGYTLMGITMLSAIMSVSWFVYYRYEYIVVSAQPLFLLLVSVGTFVMAATIFPIVRIMVLDDINDTVCMSIPWLYIIGVTFPLSAMFAKIRGVYKAYINPEIEFIEVSDLDFMTALGALLLANLIILVCWTVIAPLHWTKEKSTTDEFGRYIEGGKCKGSHDVVFVVVLAVMNMCVIVLCNWWAYKTRNIETEFRESSYIGLIVVFVLQAWIMGIIIFAVVYENAQATFYVVTCIVFVSSQAFLSFVYLPKVSALYQYLSAEASKRHLASYRVYLEKAKSTKFINQTTGKTCRNSVVPSGGLGAIAEEPSDILEDDVSRKNRPTVSTDAAPSEAVSAAEYQLNFHDVHSSVPAPRPPGFGATAPSGTETGNGNAFIAPKPPRFLSWMSWSALDDDVAPPMTTLKSNRSIWRPVRSDGSYPSRGCKITYNPRSQRNLELTGGYELSREQVEILVQMDARGITPSGDELELPLHEANEASGVGSRSLPNVMEVPEEKEEEESPNADSAAAGGGGSSRRLNGMGAAVNDFSGRRLNGLGLFGRLNFTGLLEDEEEDESSSSGRHHDVQALNPSWPSAASMATGKW